MIEEPPTKMTSMRVLADLNSEAINCGYESLGNRQKAQRSESFSHRTFSEIIFVCHGLEAGENRFS